jgi:hypothetical protein
VPAPRIVCGFCEWVSLPDLGIATLHAKIDTGARTSALHVVDLKLVGHRGSHELYEARVPVHGRSHKTRTRLVHLEIQEWTLVRDSSGRQERRPVIATRLKIGPVERVVRVSLSDRGEMMFPMLIGRTALADDFLIDAAGRDLLG